MYLLEVQEGTVVPSFSCPDKQGIFTAKGGFPKQNLMQA